MLLKALLGLSLELVLKRAAQLAGEDRRPGGAGASGKL